MSNPLFIKFIQACSTGHMREFYALFSSLSIEQKNALIAQDNYICFHLAAANGYHDIVKAILDYVKSVTDSLPAEEAVIPVFFARKGEAFKAALDNQHIKTVGLILQEEFLFDECLNIIAKNPEYIKIVWNSSLRNCILYLYSQYCGQDIALVQHILAIVPPSSHSILLEYISDEYEIVMNQFTVHHMSPFKAACAYGKLDIIQFLWGLVSLSHRHKIIETQFSSCCIMAAKNGHLDIIKQLAVWVKPNQKISFLISEDFNAFIYAADRGYIEIVQFIWESLPHSLQSAALLASNFAAYRLATKKQYFKIIDFLEANTHKETIEKMKRAVTQSVI